MQIFHAAHAGGPYGYRYLEKTYGDIMTNKGGKVNEKVVGER